MGRIIRYTFAGAIGLVIAWAIMELTGLTPRGDEYISYTRTFMIGLLSGLFLGLALGAAQALSAASRRDQIRSVLSLSLFGAAGGIAGLTIGNAFYNALSNAAESSPGIFSFTLRLIGRGLGFAIIGGLIGVSQGVAASNTKKMVNGAVGGFIGGGMGGSTLEILKWLNEGHVSNFPAWMVRFIAFSVTGAAIGLFLGFVEELTKQAWLIKLLGRNEGREILIFKPQTTLGRDEFADIPVFGDPDVAPKHAVITAMGQRHFIEDAGSTYGTCLNGAKVTQREPMQDGDLLLIGKTRFMFRDKATARSNAGRSASSVQIPTSSHVCQFCGAVKDANGNCDCTVGGQPSQPSPDLGQTVQQQMTQPLSTPAGQQTVPLAAQPAGGAKMIGMSGPYAGHSFAIDRDMEIGRDSTKGVALPMDNAVSRNHARIAIENGACVLYDDGSTNGTHVNGAKITRQQLNNSDLIQIGSTKFRFETG